MSILKSIFTRESMLQKINEVEASMAAYPVSNLLETMVIANFSLEKASLVLPQLGKSIIQQLRGKKPGPLWVESQAQWNNYEYHDGEKKRGVYKNVDVHTMIARSRFLCDLRNNYPKLDDAVGKDFESLTMKELKDLSLVPEAVKQPSIAWCIKVIALKKRASQGLEFNGIMANTTPCRKGSELLFGNPYEGDQLGHTLLCQQIASETGLSLMQANTALWVYGIGYELED